MYDISSKESFESVENVWQKEVDMYSTIPDAIKIVVGNKVDKENERKVKKEDAIAFARRNGCLFLECSAKTSEREGDIRRAVTSDRGDAEFVERRTERE